MRSDMNVLIADDDPDMAGVLKCLVARMGVNGVAVADGKEALECVKEYEFDLLVTDLRMPRMDGLQLLSEMRKRNILIPTVVVTAYGDLENVRKAGELGASAFLLKPLDMCRAEKTLKSALEQGRDAPPGEPWVSRLERRAHKLRRREKRLTDTLRKNLHFIDAILEATPSLIALAHPDGKLVTANEAFLQHLGITHKEAIGGAFLDLLTDNGMAGDARGPGGMPTWGPQETSRCRGDGTMETVEWRYAPYPYPAGHRWYVMAIGVDVSERRHAQERLRDEHDCLTAVLDTTRALIVAVGADGKILRANRACGEYLGLAEQELLQKTVDELQIADESWAEIRRRLEVSGVLSCRGTLSQERAQPVKLEWNWSSQPHGDSALYVGAGLDVTAQRLLQEQVNRLEKLGALGQLMAGLAHEINNPLAAVLGYAELLAEEDPRTTSKELELVRTSAQRCKSIVERTLRFAHADEPDLKPTSLNEAIRNALVLLENQLLNAGIRTELDLADDLPEAMADEGQMEQVFVNIFTNAMHALRRVQGARIKVSTEAACLEERDVVRVRICDNGPGIPEDILDSLFDPFFTTRPPGEGTGLGLSVCFGIVTGHGGRIWAENAADGGAAFVVEIPAGAGAKDGETTDRAGDSTTHEDPSVRRGGKRILVVDDEPMIVDILRRFLGSMGHDVVSRDTGEDALSVLEEETFDLVICDHRMPGMNGCDVYERAVVARPGLTGHFVFCTGDTASKDMDEFLLGTGCRRLRKPFSKRELADLVDELGAA